MDDTEIHRGIAEGENLSLTWRLAKIRKQSISGSNSKKTPNQGKTLKSITVQILRKKENPETDQLVVSGICPAAMKGL